MVQGDVDYVDMFIIAIIWGCTNPFLRKGTYEEDQKLLIKQEELQRQYEEQQEKKKTQFPEEFSLNASPSLLEASNHEEEGTKSEFTPMSPKKLEETMHLQCEYGTTAIDTTKTAIIALHGNTIMSDNSNIDNTEMGYSKLSNESDTSFRNNSAMDTIKNNGYNLYQENTINDINKIATSPQGEQEEQQKIPTSFTKGVLLQLLSKFCCCFSSKENNEPNKLLNLISYFHPKHIIKQFLSSLLQELAKFTKPKIAIPFFINQSSAIFYYKLIATSSLTSVTYCQAMSMAIEGVVGYMLGERMSNPLRGFGGVFLVLLGVWVCILSDDIHDYFFTANEVADDNINDQEKFNDRQLTFDDDVSGYYETGESSISNLFQGSGNGASLFEISPFVGWYAACGVIHWFLGLFHI